MKIINSYKIIVSLISTSIICALFLWIFTTTSGLTTICKIGSLLVGNNLQINNPSGTLIGPIKIGSIRYKNNILSVSAHNIQIELQISKLLLGKLKIDRLNGDDINIVFENSKYLKQKPSIIKNLFSFDLQNIFLKKIKIIHPKFYKPIAIDTMQLSTAGSSIKPYYIDFVAKSNEVYFEIHGKFKKQYNLNWNTSILDLGIMSNLSGEIKSQGDISIDNSNFIKTNVTLQGNDLQLAKNCNLAKLNLKLITDKTRQNSTLIDLKSNDLQITGHKIENIGAQGNLTTNGKSITKADLQFLPINLLHDDYNLKTKTIINGAHLKIFNDKQDILSEINVILPDQSSILGKLNIYKKRQLSGSLNWQSENLDILKILFPTTEHPIGKVDLSFSLNGTIQKPQLSGSFSLSEFEIGIPYLNLNIKNSGLLIDVTPKKIKYSGQIFNEKNDVLNLEGNTNLIPNNPATIIKLTGNDFLLANTTRNNLYFSPKITLTANNKGMNLTGDIAIPKGNIEVDDFSESETLPNDVTFVNKGSKTTITPPSNVNTHITFSLGNELYVNVSGLKGKISGNFVLDERQGGDSVGNGILTINQGSYDLYGQKLKIDQGQIIFSNSQIYNPHLNIKAFKTIDNFNGEKVLVGINIKGTVNSPISSLYSEPANLSQEDILSYMLLGQASPQTSDIYGDNAKLSSQINLMLAAIKTLNIGGSGSKFTALSNDLRNKLGFVDLKLEATSSGTKSKEIKSTFLSTTSLVLGKYLSPSLYIGYSMGLLDQLSTFKIRYKLWRNFILQTETSSVDTGIDILYSLSKN